MGDLQGGSGSGGPGQVRRAALAPRLRGGRFAGGCDALLVLADVLGESVLLSLSSAGRGSLVQMQHWASNAESLIVPVTLC